MILSSSSLSLLPATFQVAQAGLLGQRDSLSPFRAVLATSAASLLGDVLLVGQAGMGLAGAAWTTVLSQVGGVAGAHSCFFLVASVWEIGPVCSSAAC